MNHLSELADFGVEAEIQTHLPNYQLMKQKAIAALTVSSTDSIATGYLDKGTFVRDFG